MTIQIESHTACEYANYFTMSSDKKTVFLGIHKDGTMVNVCVQNAMHKAYRGIGKVFRSIEEAIANYKSGDVKAMIEEAARLSA